MLVKRRLRKVIFHFMNDDTEMPDSGAEGSADRVEELHELFLEQLADLLNAESQLTKALPLFARAARSEKLRDAINFHLRESQGHVERLQQVFASVDETPKSKTCQAMKGLIEEGSELLQELEGKSSIDAGIIAAAQKVEHYEIASYGTLRAWAEEMGHDEAVTLLEETLNEEKATNDKLTNIAEAVAHTHEE